MPNNRNENVELRLDTNTLRPLSGAGRKLFVETYGCQMNVGDTEIVVSVMQREGYVYTERIDEADVILINTCSIRDNAEQRIWGRLAEMKRYRRANPGLVVGVIGCMAERLREKLVEGPAGVDVVAGPDAYRDLPRLVREAEAGGNVLLSTEETYAEIAPVRLDRNGVSAFVAIMRGCDNFCSYCVVPYTRGRERSRDAETIVAEARSLFENGYREVTLLGQNVNSYRTGDIDFPELVRRVASVSPLLRVRFATSHPKDMSDGLLEVMASMPNVCRAIHLPAQSGATSMLGRMNRKYTREWYLDRIAAIRRYLPDCAITTDLIAGFSGETEEEHLQTLSLMREVRLHVQVFGASGHFCRKAPGGRRSRGGEVAPAVRNHRPAKRAGPCEQPARCGPGVRSAGRGRVEARQEPAVGAHFAEQGGFRPRVSSGRRLCEGSHHGLHAGHAIRRCHFRTVQLKVKN